MSMSWQAPKEARAQWTDISQEALDLSIHSPELIDCLRDYMYTLKYTRDADATMIDAELCILADEYVVPSLSSPSRSK